MVNLSLQQEEHVKKQLRKGWFWDVVSYVKRASNVSYNEAFTYVEEAARHL